jgi:hypothetical protein
MLQIFRGDIFQPPLPASRQVRYRVREIVRHNHLLAPHIHLQLFTMQRKDYDSPFKWQWMDETHDRIATPEQIEEWGFRLVETSAVQLELF